MKKVFLALLTITFFLIVQLVLLSKIETNLVALYVFFGLQSIFLGPLWLIGLAIDRLIVKNRRALWAIVGSFLAAEALSLPVLAYDPVLYYPIFLPVLIVILSGCLFSRWSRKSKSRVIYMTVWALNGNAAAGVAYLLLLFALDRSGFLNE